MTAVRPGAKRTADHYSNTSSHLIVTPYHQQLKTALAAWVDLDDDQWHRLVGLFEVRTAREQEHLLLPGDRIYELFFVCEGLLRFYYLADNGTESNKAFIAEDQFAGPLAASALDLPVIYGVQTLEPTTLLAARYADFVTLFEEHPVFDRLGRKLMEWMVVQKELRERVALHQTARERYLAFVQQYPQFAQRVPQYHIASYLGMTAESLSRLRRKLAEGSVS